MRGWNQGHNSPYRPYKGLYTCGYKVWPRIWIWGYWGQIQLAVSVGFGRRASALQVQPPYLLGYAASIPIREVMRIKHSIHSAVSRPLDKGGGGPSLAKIFFRHSRPLFGLKIGVEGRTPRAPPLIRHCITSDQFSRYLNIFSLHTLL